MKRKWKAIIMAIILFILIGCSNDQDVSVKLFEHLENTVEIELTFIENQEKVFELEKADEELYNEIIALGSDDYEEIVDLSTEAITLLDERLEYVKLEKESLEASREEFEQIEPLIDKIAAYGEKEQAEKMFEAMINRYDAYEKVYTSYSESIRLTKELYELFQQEEFQESKVYTVLANVNDSYDDVLEANESFNQETVLYNHLKEEYYEMLHKN